MLLSFPKTLGQHPDHGADITVQDGKFGPYLQMITPTRKETRSLTHEQLGTITLAEALQLLGAPNCPTGTMDVVLAPYQMILQIHESIGHPLEIDRDDDRQLGRGHDVDLRYRLAFSGGAHQATSAGLSSSSAIL